METPLITRLVERSVGVEVVEAAKLAGATRVPVTLTSLPHPKKKDGFSSKIQIPAFGGKKGHSDDVTGAFRQWARCITYY